MKHEMRRRFIGKGIKLGTYKAEGFKTANASISFAMPLSDGKNAARAVLVRLLARSDRDYPTLREMSQKLSMLYGASVGASVIKSGESQKIKLSIECIDDKFALDGEDIINQAFTLLLDLVFRPNAENGMFPQENVEREKRLLVELVKSLSDDKIYYAADKLIKEMCYGEDFSIPKYGTIEEIEKLTPSDIRDAFMDILLHAPVDIYAVGDIDEEKIEKLAVSRFGKIERKEIRELHTEFISMVHCEDMVRETQDIKQCKLVIGMRAGMTYDRDNYAALKVMNDIFGSGVYSKLFTNVREKQSLCYYCSSRLDTGKGLIVIQCGVEKENIEEAILSIKKEFNDMMLGNFDDDVIEASKMSITDAVNSTYDTPYSIEGWYSSQQTSSFVFSPEEVINMVNAVTKEEIVTAAVFATFDTIYVLEN